MQFLSIKSVSINYKYRLGEFFISVQKLNLMYNYNQKQTQYVTRLQTLRLYIFISKT